MSAIIYLDRKNWVPVDTVNQPGVFKTDIELNCVESDELRVFFANTAEYVESHKSTFNALQSGEVHNGYITLYINKEPDCILALTFEKELKLETPEELDTQEQVNEEEVLIF